MGLVVGVSIAVIIVTALTAAACYLTDQTAERHEKKS
jgi:hypothetical protein